MVGRRGGGGGGRRERGRERKGEREGGMKREKVGGREGGKKRKFSYKPWFSTYGILHVPGTSEMESPRLGTWLKTPLE